MVNSHCGNLWAITSYFNPVGYRRRLKNYHLGSADRAILCAALGQFDYGARALAMNQRRIEHYLLWAKPYSSTVRRRVGYIQGRLFHLWHGDLQNRQYASRHRILEQFDFGPFTDIAVDRNGCWRWDSDKRELHQLVRDYFRSRKKDGDGDKEFQVA